MTSVPTLPPYPSQNARKSLTAFQQAEINAKIESALDSTLSLPVAKRHGVEGFIASFATDHAHQALERLIGDGYGGPNKDQLIQKTLRLTLQHAPKLTMSTLLDLAVAFSSNHTSTIRSIFSAAINESTLAASTDLKDAFSSTMSQMLGLHESRRVAECLRAFLRVSDPKFLGPFVQSNLIMTLAKTYDDGLMSIAERYGGLTGGQDDWENIWVDTKICLLDAFHVIFKSLLKEIPLPASPRYSASIHQVVSIVSALLSSPISSRGRRIPFQNSPLIADYDQTYNVNALLRNAAGRTPQLDPIEESLRTLGTEAPSSEVPKVLKLVLKASAPVAKNFPADRTRTGTANKGKSKASVEVQPHDDPSLDISVTQILDVFPDLQSEYVRRLLTLEKYRGSHERVIEGLLDGTAPSAEDLEASDDELKSAVIHEEYVRQRLGKNEVSEDHPGVYQMKKQREDESVALRDREFIEQMKADILRRAEAISDDEEEDQYSDRGLVNDPDQEHDEEPQLKVTADGEASDNDEEHNRDVETILELAFLQNPKVFERNAQTRRSKERLDLKGETGYDDGQIEGWKIMLDRDPHKKEKVFQKHEYNGNDQQVSSQRAVDNGGLSRGRGGSTNRGRACKDRNKAQRANHRKRGHDRKMARGGAPS